MKEEFLHYIWQHKLYTQKQYISNAGEPVEIIDTGIRNTDAGPDFFNAKIKIGGTIWAGNVEIHNESAQWDQHRHNKNKAYNNVVLHAVNINNADCFNEAGRPVPLIQMEYPEYLQNNYNSLLQNKSWIACENRIKDVDTFNISFWLEKLAIERISNKTEQVEKILIANKNNWEESFYQFLARSFGFGVNNNPFEQLARSVSLKIITKHKNNLEHIEAILFGQSGLLEMNEINDEYTNSLNFHYKHFKQKYNLQPLDGFQWKFLRLRPLNFPTVRIAQLAALIHSSVHLFSKIKESLNIKELVSLLSTKTSFYWENHYHFGKESKLKEKVMGDQSIKSLIINSIVPFSYIYACKTADDILKNKSIDLLGELQAEKNSIIKGWEPIGIKPVNAFESQALIQLKKEYCDKKKCIYCAIGHNIIKTKP